MFDSPLRPIALDWEFVNRTKKEGWQFVLSKYKLKAPRLESSDLNETDREQTAHYNVLENTSALTVLTPKQHKMRQKPRAVYSHHRLLAAWLSKKHPPVSRPAQKYFKLSPGINFRMEFSENAKLVVSFLQSYEYFGRAVIIFDADVEHAEQVINANEKYLDRCEREHTSLGMHSFLCMQLMSGLFQTPLVIGGHWTDH